MYACFSTSLSALMRCAVSVLLLQGQKYQFCPLSYKNKNVSFTLFLKTVCYGDGLNE